MTEPRIQRRLAAILAADVVGYSRLMQADEVGTLSALKARWKDVLSPGVARHRGRVVKVMGDGVLVEFASAVDAVECAVALQAGFAAANDGVPLDRQIVLRVGINLGDVIVEGVDLYGDGVNVAARIEAIAEPGEILISATVREHVGGKLDLQFDDLGERMLKNIAQPLRVFRVSDGGQAAVRSALTTPTARTSSIAILPFANLGDDPAEVYFSDGFTEDLITELSRWPHLAVQSRSAAFRHRGVAVDIRQVARDLNVRYIVEGSIRRMGARARITAQLIDSDTGNHLWAEKFDRKAEDLFEVQDQVVQTIASTIMGKVLAVEADRARRKPPANLAAYDCVLQGNALSWDDPEAAAEATRLFARAVELDPDYGFAHTMLAVMLSRKWSEAPDASDDLLIQALAAAKRGVELDPTQATSLSILGWMYMSTRSFDQAVYFSDRAMEVNPNNQWIVGDRGDMLVYLGRIEEGLTLLKHVRQMDPQFTETWYIRALGHASMMAGRYPEALSVFGNLPKRTWVVSAWMAGCHARLGDANSARLFAAECLAARPAFSVSGMMAKEPYRTPDDAARVAESLRLAGLPE